MRVLLFLLIIIFVVTSFIFFSSDLKYYCGNIRDSIIVVAFRGTASSTNLKTDFNWGQETLPEHFINDQPEFRIDINSSPHVLDAESGSRSKVLRMKRDSNQGAGVNYLRSAPIARLFHSLVHSGFIKAYATIRDEIMEKVIEVMTRQMNNALDRSSADTKEGKKVAFIMPKIYVTGELILTFLAYSGLKFIYLINLQSNFTAGHSLGGSRK